MKKLKTVLIGCGAIAVAHTDVMKRLDGNIVAVCDIDKEKAIRHCERFGLHAKIYTDYRQMLDIEEPDVAHILTPHYLHTEMIVEVLGRNIHCLCEKPLYIKPEDYGVIDEAVTNSKAMLGVCFQHRYIANNQYVKQQVEAEGFEGAAAFQAWHKDAAYYASGDWRGRYATEGGALLINQAIHCIDQFIWFGGMPKTVTANLATHTLADCIEAEDTAELFFDYGNGIVSQLYATNTAVSNFTGVMNVRTGGGNYEFHAKQLLKNNEFVVVNIDSVDIDGKSYWGIGHYNLIRHYYECVKTGEHFPIDHQEASKAVKIVLAAGRSHGQPVEIEK